jgi:glycosyltransferase involved in cell wall biosynthesis
MNILLINYNNPFQESGIVVLDLFNEFKKKGHNVKVLVNTYNAYYPEGIISMETFFTSLKRRLLDKVQYHLKIDRNFLTKTDPKYCIFGLNEQKIFYKTSKLLDKANFIPQVTIILFAKDFINTKNIYELYYKTNSPVLWVMFDMAPLTGGCHYAWDCERYKKSCGNCPGLFSANPFDITFKNLNFKKNFIDRTNIQIIAGSEWQYRQAKESFLFRDKIIHKILISVDPTIFKPVDKLEIRRKMGIPTDKKVIFFGALGLNSARKGMKYLLESLTKLKEMIKEDSEFRQQIFLLTAGNGFDKIRDYLPFEYKSMGLLDNTCGIASCYQAADIFICPSIEDSGPTMINQSLMCGTPVVSFEMGVASDLVKTGETGYLARIKDSKDLAQGVFNTLMLNRANFDKLSENCRNLALNLCSPEVQINKFENIIKSITTD